MRHFCLVPALLISSTLCPTNSKIVITLYVLSYQSKNYVLQKESINYQFVNRNFMFIKFLQKSLTKEFYDPTFYFALPTCR